jgi:glycosyltransferase involved in cell wall biosynthesis
MKIALIALQASPLSPSVGADPDNQSDRVSSLARALTRQDHRVTVYARKDAESLPRTMTLAPGVTVEYVPAGPPEPLTGDKLAAHVPEFGAYLADRWRSSAPDVAHAHFWTSGLAALAAARGLPIPVVQTFQSLGDAGDQTDQGKPRRRPVTANPAVRLRLEPVIARSVRAVLAGSSAEMSALAQLGVPRTSLRVVPRGVDTSAYAPDGPAAQRDERPRLLSVGPLTAAQGLDTVLRALPDVPGAELVIAGHADDATPGADKVQRGLVKLARELGVADRLVWHGPVSAADLPALLRSADLLVDMATQEPATSVTLEAMACGIPVVATAVGSNKDTVVDGITGALVPPGEPALLARRLRRLLGNPMLLRGYGLAATDRARSRYSWERIGRETLAIYERSLPHTDLVSRPALAASR